MVRRRRPRVLVTGGSIAGPALAWGLCRAGWEPVVLERSASRRDAGQNIDIRGLGHEVLRRMGMGDLVRADLTGEVGTRFVDGAGRVHAEIPRVEGRDGPTAELEILRGRLAAILLGQIEDDVEVRYGDFVTGVDQDGSGVEVSTDAGRQERFDLLLIAEGRSSRTRGLLFGPETRYDDKGLNLTYGTIDRRPGDDDWWTWMNATEGRVVMIRPDNLGTLRAALSFTSVAFGFETLPRASQLHILRERFAMLGWRTGRVLDGFAARPQEVYAERLAQVTVSTWSKGRVALVGDAAWGSGPTGMGTTLALVGAHVLAGELAATATEPGHDPTGAFQRYERLLRRYAETAQNMPPGMPGLMHPTTRTGLAVLRTAQRALATRPGRALTEKAFTNGHKHAPRLPAYPHLRG